jgi:hypothetical protein
MASSSIGRRRAGALALSGLVVVLSGGCGAEGGGAGSDGGGGAGGGGTGGGRTTGGTPAATVRTGASSTPLSSSGS